ncbi:MAG: alkene reductase [Gammaproteobacteria bacterium]|nr:alkene reductase [Gammaproteobacteria bacterium]
MAPLTRNRAGADNVPQALNVEYYTQRASAGLIITEATQVSPQGVGYPATPGIHSAEHVAGWRQVTEAVHAKGGRIFLQLWHVGRISHPSLQPEGALPVAPSALKPAGQAMTYEGPKDFVTPRALELAELPGIVDQFLRDGANHRTDAYGGSVENRARLMLEVTEAVCAVWGAECVGIRLSPLQPFNDMRDSNPQATFSYTVEQLNRFGLAYLHVTEVGKDAPGAAGPAFDLAALRRLWKGVYMTNGGYDLARANAALTAGDADMVAFGALFLANPDLPLRFAKWAPLNPPDPDTFYGGDAKGYTDYPFLEAD